MMWLNVRKYLMGLQLLWFLSTYFYQEELFRLFCMSNKRRLFLNLTKTSWKMSDDEYDTHCPLCVEEMDLSDQNFLPCPCGYKVRSIIACEHHLLPNFDQTSLTHRFVCGVGITYEKTWTVSVQLVEHPTIQIPMRFLLLIEKSKYLFRYLCLSKTVSRTSNFRC